MLKKIFVICNKSVEKERYKNLEKQFQRGNINKDLVEYYLYCWKTDIEEKKKKNNGKFFYNKFEIHNLNNGEISILINNIELLKKIKEEYNEGYFIIFESDAYAFPKMKFNQENIDLIIKSIKNIEDWDIVNVGARCQQLFEDRGYPKSKPIKINGLNFNKEDRLICIEALIWNYKSICKFLDLFNNIKRKILAEPIDVIYDIFSKKKLLNTYWTNPPICTQGSGSVFKSNIR